METNETAEHTAPKPVIRLTMEAQGYLREAGSWARFLGILGFIACVLVLVGALFIGALFTVFVSVFPTLSSVPEGVGGFLSIIIILFDLLYFFFALYLFQFGSRVKRGISIIDTNQLTQGLGKLKSFFKLWGIVTIVILCINVLQIIYFLVSALRIASSMQH
jgi:hypothetical protein